MFLHQLQLDEFKGIQTGSGLVFEDVRKTE
jgi:hypothetical protein